MSPLDPRTFVELSAGLCLAYVVLAWRLKDAARRVRALGDRDEDRRGDPLPLAAPPARPALPAGLAAGDLDSRLETMRDLAEERGPDAVPFLAALLLDEVAEVATEAANLLGSIGGPEALRALLEADGAASPVPAPAPEAPAEPEAPEEARLPPPAPAPSAGAAGLSDPLRKAGYRALHRYTPHDPEGLDDPALIGVLLALARASDEPPALRYYALRDLAPYDHPDIPETLLDLLEDPLPLIRYSAAEQLGVHGDADAVPALVEALEDPVGNVRASAAHTLATLGGDIAIRPLLSLRDDPDEVVRYAARRALDAIGKRKRIGGLLSKVAS